MPELAPGFESLLGDFDLDVLERHGSSVFGVTPDFRLGYLNPAWFAFAKANDGAQVLERFPLGASILPALEGPLAAFYRTGFARCLEGLQVWSHDYECSSATVQRRFWMNTYRLTSGQGLLCVNSLLVEQPIAHSPRSEDLGVYVNDDGFALQCVHCRRVRWQDGSDRWDFVPLLVERPHHPTSHGMCPVCHQYHSCV